MKFFFKSLFKTTSFLVFLPSQLLVFASEPRYSPQDLLTLDSDLLDLEIKPSTLPKAGLGLFSKKTFEIGEILSEFRGPIIDSDKLDDSLFELENKLIYINWRYSLIGRCPAAFANDCIDFKEKFNEKDMEKWRKNREFPKHKGCEYNAEIEIVGNKVFLVAKREIYEGEEIFLDYGLNYWDFFFEKKLKMNNF